MSRYFFLLTFFFNSYIVFCQNIGIGTTAPQGKLHIAGTENVSQLIINANANGPQSNTNPFLKLRYGNTDVLWLHTDLDANLFMGVNAGRLNDPFAGGVYNMFIGYSSGYSNTSGSNNTVLGPYSLYSNTSGSYNTGVGMSVLRNNTNGNFNTAIGDDALYSNIGGDNNTALGRRSLYLNTTGGQNTSTGFYALYSNTTGSSNVASGHLALNSNTTGSFNTGIGNFALRFTTASQYNTSIGYNAGDSYDNGYNNVFVGANTDVNAAGYFNVIAVGQGTVVGGSSTARFGNAATSSYGGWAGWTNVSDGRYKKNIRENVPGLAFINKLRPVTYNLAATALDAFLHSDNKNEMKGAALDIYEKALKEKEKITYTGFIAQEVEAAAKELSFDFSGIDTPKSANDTYGLRYAEFVVPLVKAVQEQQQQITDMQKKIALLEEQNSLLLQLLKKDK